MKRLASALIAVLTLTCAQGAAAQDGVFRNYDDMRGNLDRMMMSRDIKEVMLTFGGADEMTVQQLDDLQARVRQIFPEDFTEVTLVRRNELQNGWAQELIAYRTGLAYIFAYVLMQQTSDAMVAVNFQFNSDFNTLNSQF